jgi:hypothetical protein
VKDAPATLFWEWRFFHDCYNLNQNYIFEIRWIVVRTVAMPAPITVFLDFKLSGTTWFYCSLILAVGLFFKFGRLLSVRNWDVISLFLLVPGLLLLQEAQSRDKEAVKRHETPEAGDNGTALAAQAEKLRGIAYVWLLCGSGYFLLRCFVDLALVRRPALGANLSFGGLAWLGVALFVCLVSVAARAPEESSNLVGKKPAPVAEMERRVETVAGDVAGSETRFWVERGLAIGCHLAIVTGLIVIGWRHFQDVYTGLAAATFYLLLPYTALHVGQLHHVWPIALLVWAAAAYRLPTVAGLFLGLAAGSVYFPVLVFPLWLNFYWKRGAGRFALFFSLAASLSLTVVGLVMWLEGNLSANLESALKLSDWQVWRPPTTEGFWKGVQWAYRIPVFIAYLAMVITTAIWPSPKNLAHVLALTAAVLIGIQFWYADQGGLYVLWYLPLLLLLVFRPNLTERRPLTIAPETDWVAGLSRRLGRLTRRLFRAPEPLVRAH